MIAQKSLFVTFEGPNGVGKRLPLSKMSRKNWVLWDVVFFVPKSPPARRSATS